jgi:hypothetical protein
MNDADRWHAYPTSCRSMLKSEKVTKSRRIATQRTADQTVAKASASDVFTREAHAAMTMPSP